MEVIPTPLWQPSRCVMLINKRHLFSRIQHKFFLIKIVPLLHVSACAYFIISTFQLSAGKRRSANALNYIVAHSLQQNSKQASLQNNTAQSHVLYTVS